MPMRAGLAFLCLAPMQFTSAINRSKAIGQTTEGIHQGLKKFFRPTIFYLGRIARTLSFSKPL